MMLMYNVVAQTGDIDKEEVDSSLTGDLRPAIDRDCRERGF